MLVPQCGGQLSRAMIPRHAFGTAAGSVNSCRLPKEGARSGAGAPHAGKQEALVQDAKQRVDACAGPLYGEMCKGQRTALQYDGLGAVHLHHLGHDWPEQRVVRLVCMAGRGGWGWGGWGHLSRLSANAGRISQGSAGRKHVGARQPSSWCQHWEGRQARTRARRSAAQQGQAQRWAGGRAVA